RSQCLRVDSNQVALVENGFHALLERDVYARPPATDTPVNVASRLASGVLRLRPTLTSPSITTQAIPGMSPRAIAPRASSARDAQARERAGLAAAPQDVERRAEVARLHHLERHRRLADDRVEPRLVERRRPAVDVAADVGPEVEQDVVGDRARPRDRGAARV